MVNKALSLDGIVWEEPPYRYESGTPNASGACALEAACMLYWKVGYRAIAEKEAVLMKHLVNGLLEIPGIRILGSDKPEDHRSVVSFTHDKLSAQKIATMLGDQDICVRSGYHCAQPLHAALNGGEPSCRVSTMFYNTLDEIVFRFLPELKKITEGA